MRRRLLECLEESVERLFGQTVNLIDDIYLVVAAYGAVTDILAQLPDVIDTAIGGGVDFKYIGG